ncbi:MAG: hypothetical protein MJ211_01080 [Bacteroidales bacterium]|nr:hypothetical protein [Bacteroidales bacterium]
MKIKIEYKDQNKFGKEDLLSMKQFIEQKRISGLKKIDFTKPRVKKGEMGGGIGTALAALIGSATGPLTTLAQALVEWVQLHRSDIKIKLGDGGEEVVISANIRRSKKAINEIIETVVNKSVELRQKAPLAVKGNDKPLPPPPIPNDKNEGNK